MFCPKCGTENPETGKFCRNCGTDISGISRALSNASKDDLWGGSEMFDSSCNSPTGNKINTSNPDDLFSSGVKAIITGLGFAVVSVILLLTGVAGAKVWWWSMLFPAFFSFANGVSNILKSNSLRRKQASGNPLMQNQFPVGQVNQSLPAAETEFIKPQQSIYNTGDLAVPSSVTEHTTKHLEMDNEGETMTLPKK